MTDVEFKYRITKLQIETHELDYSFMITIDKIMKISLLKKTGN